MAGRAFVAAIVALVASLGVDLLRDRASLADDLAGAGKKAPPPATVALRGRVDRDGKGAGTRVRAWALPSLPPRELAEATVRDVGRRSDFYRYLSVDDDSWWLSPEGIAKATRVLASDERGELEAKSGEDGAFTFDVPVASTDWLVRATASDGLDVFIATRRVAEKPFEPVALHLPVRGVAVEGRAVHADDSPFLGTISLIPPGQRLPVKNGTSPQRTNEEGKFAFAHVIEGGYRLRTVAEDGAESVSLPGFVPLDAPWVYVVDEPTVAVRGKVHTPRGAPVAGASIELVVSTSAGRETRRSVTSDAEGAFNTRREQGQGTVHVEAAGFPSVTTKIGPLAGAVDVVLTPFAGIRGRVVDRAGAGVARVPVFVVEGVGTVGLDVASISTTSRDDGQFELDSRAGSAIRLLAFGGGYMSAEIDDLVYGGFDPLPIDLTTASIEPIELRVVPAGRLEGRVVDREGKPIADARIAFPQADPMVSPYGNGYHRHPVFPFLPDPEPVATGADGRFVFGTLRPSLLYHGSVVAPGCTPQSREVVLEEAGPTTVTWTLDRFATAGPPRTVNVRVIASDRKKPVAGAALRLSMYPERDRESATDDEGAARFDDVPAIEARVLVHAIGWLDASVNVPNDAPSTGAAVSLSVELSPALTVSGKVLMPDGKPARGADVGASQGNHAIAGANVLTSDDGRFVLTNVPAGPISLSASLYHFISGWDGKSIVPQSSEGGAHDVVIHLVEIRVEQAVGPFLRSGGTVTFHVVDPDGRPVPRGRFALVHDDDRASAWTQRFEDGEITIAPADQGLWSVIALAGEPVGGGALLAPVATQSFRITTPPADRTLRMPFGDSVEGRVLAADGGVPVAHVKLFAHNPTIAEAARRESNARAIATSRADGTFRIEGLPKGTSALSFDVAPSFAEPKTRDIVSGQPIGDIRLAASVRPWITVLGIDGEPVEGALVAVGSEPSESEIWEWLRTTPRTGVKGRCRLTGLDPARTYELAVLFPTGTSGYRAVRRPIWRPQDTVVRASEIATVSGRMRSPSGDPIEGAWVALDPSGSAPREAWEGYVVTAADGTFTTSDLPPGEGTLRFGIGTAGPSGSMHVVVPSADVDVVLEPGPTWVLRLDGVPVDRKGNVTVRWTPWREDGAKASESPITRYQPWPQELRFSGLSPGEHYAVFIDGYDFVAWIPDLTGAGGTRTLSVVKAGTISGHVRIGDGSQADLNAMVRIEAHGFTTATAVEKGAFTLRGLPPGTFTIHASRMDSDARAHEATATVSTGETVDLVIPAATGHMEPK